MGAIISAKCKNFQKKDTRRYGADQYELTEKEKKIVRTTWPMLIDKADVVSVDIFLRIFELIPHAKQLFPFKNAVGDALMEHPYLKGHAMRFLNAVGMTVVNLDALEIILIPSLLKLGQQHIDIKGFKHEYFETFVRALNDVFKKHLGRAYNRDTRIAWNKILNLITSTVEQGYREGQEINIKRESQQQRILIADDKTDGESGQNATDQT